MSVQCIPPFSPLLYSKSEVYWGIPIFLTFAPKHRLWVLLRIASATYLCFEQHNLFTTYVLSKIRKILKIFY